METFYEKIMRPFLFMRDPEYAHGMAVRALKTMGSVPSVCHILARFNKLKNTKPVQLFGLKFPNVVGLAAGFDKNAEVWHLMDVFGFGFVEIGTVTYQRQPGNPRPRIFRYPDELAVINRLGFNNEGAPAVAKRLSKMRHHPFPLGINIGKSKAITLDQAVEDYVASFHLLADYADYLTINISSPNTPGLRTLQEKKHLEELLGALQHDNKDRARRLGGVPIPMLVKISPDLSFRQIDALLEVVQNLDLNGIVATNTTTARPDYFANVNESGGLSGYPLHEQAVKIVNYIARATQGKLAIIGTGGIVDEVTAGDFMDAGASLIQIYTGWIYRGPFFPKRLAKALSWKHSNWIGG